MIDTAEQKFSFAEFEVDAAKQRLLKNGSTVALNPKAFDLLLALIENHGQIVRKEELLEKVWANQFVEENNLTVHISSLRKIFGEKKGEQVGGMKVEPTFDILKSEPRYQALLRRVGFEP